MSQGQFFNYTAATYILIIQLKLTLFEQIYHSCTWTCYLHVDERFLFVRDIERLVGTFVDFYLPFANYSFINQLRLTTRYKAIALFFWNVVTS